MDDSHAHGVARDRNAIREVFNGSQSMSSTVLPRKFPYPSDKQATARLKQHGDRTCATPPLVDLPPCSPSALPSLVGLGYKLAAWSEGRSPPRWPRACQCCAHRGAPLLGSRGTKDAVTHRITRIRIIYPVAAANSLRTSTGFEGGGGSPDGRGSITRQSQPASYSRHAAVISKPARGTAAPWRAAWSFHSLPDYLSRFPPTRVRHAGGPARPGNRQWRQGGFSAGSQFQTGPGGRLFQYTTYKISTAP